MPGVDIVRDLLDVPYLFASDSVDEVYLNHVNEHFTLADGQRVLAEADRRLPPGGLLYVRVPHVFSVAA